MAKTTLVCFWFGLMVAVTAAPRAKGGDVHSELMRLVQADAKAAAKGDAAKAPPPPAVPARRAPVVAKTPAGTLGEPASPELWNYFTDTGILTAARGRKVTTELTFGPCTDGELLNQRYFW